MAASQRCGEADRLSEIARRQAVELRDARRRRAELNRTAETDGRLADRRRLREAKLEAQQAYQVQLEQARDGRGVTVAAAAWLHEITQLNRTARLAVRRAAQVNRESAQLDALVARLELAADAARIAAASAREACLDARRTLAACEEASDVAARAPIAPLSAASPARPVALSAIEQAPAEGAALSSRQEPAVVGLLRGDRGMLQAVVSRLAEEIGQDAGRLQLLMLELREAIIEVARRACAFDFPPRHPFWSQFSRSEARVVAAALAALGRRFDGHGGWEAGAVAQPRELATALSLAGRDPRSIRRPPTAAEIETLWQGTTVGAAEHLLSLAPDLRLDAIVAFLGPRAEPLADLWDNWGRLRLLLLGTDPSMERRA